MSKHIIETNLLQALLNTALSAIAPTQNLIEQVKNTVVAYIEPEIENSCKAPEAGNNG